MAAIDRRIRVGNVGTGWYLNAKHASHATSTVTRAGIVPLAWTKVNSRGANLALQSIPLIASAPTATIVETTSGRNGTAFSGLGYPATCWYRFHSKAIIR